MTHLAMALAIAHPGVTSAIIGPRTMEQLDDLLASVDVTLTGDILDQIDEIVPPGTNVGAPDQSAYLPRPSRTLASAAAPSANAPPPDDILHSPFNSGSPSRNELIRPIANRRQ